MLENLWEQFFPFEKYVAEDSRLNLIDLLHKYFLQNPQSLANVNLTKSRTHFFDVQEMKSKLPFSDFEGTLTENPVDFAACLGLAVSVVANERSPYRSEPIIIFAAFYNLSHTMGFADVKAETVGKLIALEGSVSRVSPSRPLVLRAGFKCYKCTQMTFTTFEDGVYQTPNLCGTPRCDNRILEFDRGQVTLSDFQRLRMTETTSDHGAMPRSLEMEIRGGLVNQCIPGDVLRLVGIVKTVQVELSRGQRFANRGSYGGGRGGGGAGGRGGAAASGGGGPSFRQESGLHELYVLVQSIECLQTAREHPRPQPRPSASLSQNTTASSSTQTAIVLPTSSGHFLVGADAVQYESVASMSAAESAPQVNKTGGSNRKSSDDYASEELRWIRQLALSDQALSVLLANLCPDIYGHELVKMGLLLGLFGGSSSNNYNGNNNAVGGSNGYTAALGEEGPSAHSSIGSGSSGGQSASGKGISGSVRSNIHLLLVGDAGMGKSRLLRSCLELSPRAVFVGGATSTTAGLTATVSRESSGSGSRQGTDLCVEAGALVLADSGLCCIDELDKAACDTHALLEAMEQQRVSLAKGGVVINLRARTTVFAAANPATGKYQARRSLSENIHMHPALLSRFDLVFLLVDTPDVERDRAIGAHIAGFSSATNPQHFHDGDHGSRKRPREEEDFSFDSVTGIATIISTSGGATGENEEDNDEEMTLQQRLRRRMARDMYHPSYRTPAAATCTPYLMRKYIEYARRYVHPTLSNEAARILQRFYLHSRGQSSSSATTMNGLPITLRHLESLVRLAQARARVDLRSEVSADDARDVVMLYTEALQDAELFAPDPGVGGRRGGGPGSRGGRLGQAKKLFDTLLREAQRRPSSGNANIFQRSEMQQVKQRLGIERDISELIDTLREDGYLIKKGPETFQLVPS